MRTMKQVYLHGKHNVFFVTIRPFRQARVGPTMEKLLELIRVVVVPQSVFQFSFPTTGLVERCGVHERAVVFDSIRDRLTAAGDNGTEELIGTDETSLFPQLTCQTGLFSIITKNPESGTNFPSCQ